jgi:NAD(P)-dependent dehydrogenase (short-subunit alcohol dehydrogenase family)
MDLKGKRVLITGSTRGIGRCAAQMFHEAGASVAINGRNPDTVNSVVRELGRERLAAAIGDVSTVDGCQAVVDAAVRGLGGLDCLVNNVGTWSTSKEIMDVSEDEWDRVMNLNMRSALFCSKAAVPALRSSRGSIIFVASTAAVVAGPSESLLYSVAKAGLFGLTRTLAVETAADGIRVNCVCPGFVDTAGCGGVVGTDDAALRATAAKVVPLGRMSSLRECASTLLYLASDDAAYFTASILVNDGGCTANAGWSNRP